MLFINEWTITVVMFRMVGFPMTSECSAPRLTAVSSDIFLIIFIITLR